MHLPNQRMCVFVDFWQLLYAAVVFRLHPSGQENRRHRPNPIVFGIVVAALVLKDASVSTAWESWI